MIQGSGRGLGGRRDDGGHLKFDKEELTITISGLGGGWALGQLGELSLLDSAQLQFPSMWNNYKTSVAMRF